MDRLTIPKLFVRPVDAVSRPGTPSHPQPQNSCKLFERVTCPAEHEHVAADVLFEHGLLLVLPLYSPLELQREARLAELQRVFPQLLWRQDIF